MNYLEGQTVELTKGHFVGRQGIIKEVDGKKNRVKIMILKKGSNTLDFVILTDAKNIKLAQ